jgi:hypothetical protein
VAGCAVVVAACAAARAAGVEGTGLGAVQLLPTLVLLGAGAAAVDAMAASWAPGANDNAAGVAVALAVHEELSRRPPAGFAPALLLHGAGAPGPQALRAHLRGERLKPREALVLEIGPSGAGGPAWATRHTQVRDAARRASEALDATPRRGLRPPAGTGRLPAIALGAVDAAGVAAVEDVDPAVLDAVVDLALAVVDALDADLAVRPSVNVG